MYFACLSLVLVTASLSQAGVVRRSIRDHPHHFQFAQPRNDYGKQLSRESSVCPSGQMYVPSIDLCLPAERPASVSPLQSASLIRDLPAPKTYVSSRTQLASDCKSDEVYNSELSLCLKVQKSNRAPFPILNLVKDKTEDVSLEAFESSVQTAADCKQNEFYLSELSICVETNNVVRPPALQSALPSGLQSASLIKEKPSMEAIKSSQKSDCQRGEIYVSELGICQPASPSRKTPLQSASLVKEPVSAEAIWEETRCGPGEVHVAELNICLPAHTSERRPAPPPSASLVKEQPGIVSFGGESQSPSDCGTGQVYIAELSICA